MKIAAMKIGQTVKISASRAMDVFNKIEDVKELSKIALDPSEEADVRAKAMMKLARAKFWVKPAELQNAYKEIERILKKAAQTDANDANKRAAKDHLRHIMLDAGKDYSQLPRMGS